jgi:hypothetical protein
MQTGKRLIDDNRAELFGAELSQFIVHTKEFYT